MSKPKCCWDCEHLISYNPEEDKCDLDGHIFEDRFILSASRDKDCPLDKWYDEMEETEKRKEHEEWLESLEKGEQE